MNRTPGDKTDKWGVKGCAQGCYPAGPLKPLWDTRGQLGGEVTKCRLLRDRWAKPEDGESFQVLGSLCCAIQPWGCAASLAQGSDVMTRPCLQTLWREAAWVGLKIASTCFVPCFGES